MPKPFYGVPFDYVAAGINVWLANNPGKNSDDIDLKQVFTFVKGCDIKIESTKDDKTIFAEFEDYCYDTYSLQSHKRIYLPQEILEVKNVENELVAVVLFKGMPKASTEENQVNMLSLDAQFVSNYINANGDNFDKLASSVAKLPIAVQRKVQAYFREFQVLKPFAPLIPRNEAGPKFVAVKGKKVVVKMESGKEYAISPEVAATCYPIANQILQQLMK